MVPTPMSLQFAITSPTTGTSLTASVSGAAAELEPGVELSTAFGESVVASLPPPPPPLHPARITTGITIAAKRMNLLLSITGILSGFGRPARGITPLQVVGVSKSKHCATRVTVGKR
jgi:hypothetical protein